MSTEFTEAVADAFGSEAGTAYRLSAAMAARFRGKAVVEGLPEVFSLDEFVWAGRCEARPDAALHAELVTTWSRAEGLARASVTFVFDVTWEGHALKVARAAWAHPYREVTRHWVVADDEETARRFVEAVCAHCNDPHESVLVFQGRCWSHSRAMWREIQAARFDDLVLAGDMAQEIQQEFQSFLAAREEYARYRVPWKRGVLFVGPPGNGKTHCLRATIRLIGAPCLYVQSLHAPYQSDDENIAKVFARAREVSPCCLVFEDLDAMINDQNRSTFLNQLDGFADASGLLTLATTNHPERLDPAILERPSRFDRKYHFELPGPVERARYIAAWNDRLDPAMRVTDADLRALVEGTDGFSFAYIKELFLSSMLRWARTRTPGAMGHTLQRQLQELRAQMTTTARVEPVVQDTIREWRRLGESLVARAARWRRPPR